MVTSLCLITCALATAQAGDRADWLLTPQLQKGLELVYSGTCTDESLIPHVVMQRKYRLELHALVLAADPKETHFALLTGLSLRDRVADKEPRKSEAPLSVRLALGRLDMQGKFVGAGGDNLLTSISGPPTVETGLFVDFPLVRVSKNQLWQVIEEGRPARSWVIVGTELEGGVTCLKLKGEQQSDDWDRPRGDTTAWRRRDTVWLNPTWGVAHKVERVIERRAPSRREPTERTTVEYTLETRFKYFGRLLEDRHREILKATRFQEEAAPLLKQPPLYKPQIEALQRKLVLSLEGAPPTPYRKAIVQLNQQLELARKGELPAAVRDEVPALPRTVKLGQRAPDVVVSELKGKNTTRLNRLLGKPVLVFFYNPAAASSREMLRFIHDLAGKQPGAVNFLAMAVTDDPDAARKQHADMELPFPVHDGKAFHTTFGVEATPRLVLIDSEGIVRATHTGWGIQSAKEIGEEIQRCLPRK